MGKSRRYQLGNAKRGHAPRLLADLARPTAKKALGGRTLALRELILSWPAAVGWDFASGTRPEALSRARAGLATLTLAVDPSRALEVQHEAQRYLERVNAYFGYDMVARLRIVQRTVRLADPADAPPPKPDIAPGTRQDIAERLSGIKDDGARAVLQEMGERIAARKRQRSPRS